jgi:hypothetical protein
VAVHASQEADQEQRERDRREAAASQQLVASSSSNNGRSGARADSPDHASIAIALPAAPAAEGTATREFVVARAVKRAAVPQ